MGWQCRLRENYESLEDFEYYDNIYRLALRLGFNTAEEAWEENPHIHGSVNPGAWGQHLFPDCYLHVRDCRSGEEWIRPIRGNTKLDMDRLIKLWVKEWSGGELRMDGKSTCRLEGDFYATIKLNGEPPDSISAFASGGFYLKGAYHG